MSSTGVVGSAFLLWILVVMCRDVVKIEVEGEGFDLPNTNIWLALSPDVQNGQSAVVWGNDPEEV
jgi:hypothetical protein